MKFFHNWLQFINERFNPLPYGLMLAVFLGAHYAVYQPYSAPPITISALIPLCIAIVLFFFRLRLFDELKDFESDQIQYPHRPLPRGLLQPSDCLRIATISITVELALFSLYGRWALLSAMGAIGYSLLMYKEFFIRSWLRAHLTTYAITHTIVVVGISITFFVALLHTSPTHVPVYLLLFSLAGWFLFTIFEFGRKTWSSREERLGIDSYSKIFGRYGAVVWVIVMAMASTTLFWKDGLFTPFSWWIVTLGVLGLLYAICDRPIVAKIYRIATMLFIIAVYTTIIYSYGIL